MKKGFTAMLAASAVLPAVLCGLIVPAAAPVKEARANSAPPYWEGVTASGAIVTGGQCPVVVEKETLTLDIQKLPARYATSADEFASSLSRVTAEYSFYNPTEMQVDMQLVFPFGQLPDYAYGYWTDSGEHGYYDDTAQYRITADGEDVEREVRYTYRGYYYGGNFSPDEMKQLSDEIREDDFFSPGLKLQSYGYTVEGLGDDGGLLELTLDYNPSRTHILCADYRSAEVENGRLVLRLWARRNGETLGFLVAGEAPVVTSVRITERFTTDGEYQPIKGASCYCKVSDETTFGEFVEERRPEQIANATDYYNGVLDYLNGDYSYLQLKCGFVGREPTRLDATYFMRWYAYSLSLPAGGRVVNSVSAPLYPTVYNSGRHEFTYYLSPAQKWADFGEIEIFVNTPYEISDASLDFETTRTGYYLKRDGLPFGELTFAINEEQEGGGYMGNCVADDVFAIIGIVFVSATVFSVIFEVAASIIVAIVFGVRAGQKKKQK